MVNLIKVQGYIAVLDSEIDTPQKLGPGTSREEWKTLSSELSDSLIQLDEILQSTDWELPNE